MIKTYTNVKTGNQKIVGFIANAKTESAKRKVILVLFKNISLTTISEIIITDKSGEGDCTNSRKNGINISSSQDFFSIE